MRWPLVWGVLFLICLGLGYPTINRYAPSQTAGTLDARLYAAMVTDGPRAVEGLGRYRVLVPTLAGPVARGIRGRGGSWDPVFVGLLVVNAGFCAAGACLLAHVGTLVTGHWPTGLVGALLYLLNFAVPNYQLSGLVDSAEGCLMIALIWALWSRRGWVLPWLGIVGALAKETCPPLLLSFAAIWWLASADAHGRRACSARWLAALGAAGLITLVAVAWVVDAEVRWPWHWPFLLGMTEQFRGRLLAGVTHHGFWYVFIWLLPLGLPRMRDLPKPWRLASWITVLPVVLVGTYYQAGANLSRPLFHVTGPLLSLSAACWLTAAGRAPQGRRPAGHGA